MAGARTRWPTSSPSAANEQRFEAFYDLLLDLLARLVRARATGQAAAPRSLALAERLIPEARLPAWAALWEGILREKADAALLNLDKALILGTFARLEALARRCKAGCRARSLSVA